MLPIGRGNERRIDPHTITGTAEAALKDSKEAWSIIAANLSNAEMQRIQREREALALERRQAAGIDEITKLLQRHGIVVMGI